MITRFKELLLQNRSAKQTIAKNIFWLSASQGSRILRMLILIYAARVLGTTEYGLFSYILSLLSILSLFSDIGIGPLLSREIAGHKDKEIQNQYFATSFWLRILCISITSLGIIIIAPHISKIESAKPLINIAVFFVIFDNIREIIFAYIRGLAKMELETLIVTIMNITMALAGFFVLMWQPSAKGLLLIYIISSAASLSTGIIIVRKILGGIFKNFKTTLAKEILNNCWPIAISGAVGMIMTNIDIVMLGWWRTPAEIGLYSAGQKIIQVLYTLPGLLAAGIFPTLSAIIKDNNPQKEKALIEKSMTMVFFFTLPVMIGGIILSQPIFKFIYGTQYLPGVPIFRILLLNLFFNFPGIIISSLVLAHNQQKKMVKYVVTASLTNIILNILFIPIWGIIGSAIATLIAQTINVRLTWREIKKVSHFNTLLHLKKMALSAIVMGIFSFIMNEFGIQVIANVALSALIYLGFLFILKEKMIREFIDLVKLIRNRKIQTIDTSEINP